MQFRWIRIATSLGAATLLVSCQPPQPIVYAVQEGGALIFHIRDQDFVEKIFGWADKEYILERMTIAHGSEVVWSVRYDPASVRNCRPERRFPIAYGEDRCGYRQDVKAAELKRTVQYSISVDTAKHNRERESSSDRPAGAFMIDIAASVENIRTY